MTLLDDARRVLQERARFGRQMTVVFPEGGDVRVVAAARQLVDDGLARPVLLGEPDDIAAAAMQSGVTLAGIDVIGVKAAAQSSPALALAIQKQRPSITTATAQKLLQKPLYLGGALVAAGHVDGMVAGVANPTKRVIEASLMTIGLAAGIATPSSFFVMTCPFAVGGSKTVLFADCAVNADPDAAALAAIAIASAESARRVLGVEPRVALLSFSTRDSAQHPFVDKVKAALTMARAIRPSLAIDGELQGDAALSSLVADKKIGGGSAVAGQANVLVFPDLDAGNIAYKLTQYLGGATATGPFLQGFARPVSDLSRGASENDIYATSAIMLASTHG